MYQKVFSREEFVADSGGDLPDTSPVEREWKHLVFFVLPKYTHKKLLSFFLISSFFLWSRVLNCVQTLGELLFFPFYFSGVLLSPQNKCPAPPKHFIYIGAQ